MNIPDQECKVQKEKGKLRTRIDKNRKYEPCLSVLQ
jgi:hypothetical protein